MFYPGGGGESATPGRFRSRAERRNGSGPSETERIRALRTHAVAQLTFQPETMNGQRVSKRKRMKDAMVVAAFAGFTLGLGLILAIGAQNAFVLRQGLRGVHVFWVCMTCALSDALLIAGGVTGFDAVAKAVPQVVPVMRWGGAAFLIIYGLLSFKAASDPAAALEPANAGSDSLARVLVTCLALTWLNPHVYLDTVLLLGSVSTQWGDAKIAFGSGAVVASFTFFFTLGYGAGLLRPFFARPVSWRVLEALVGCTMWAIAAKLLFG